MNFSLDPFFINFFLSLKINTKCGKVEKKVPSRQSVNPEYIYICTSFKMIDVKREALSSIN